MAIKTGQKVVLKPAGNAARMHHKDYIEGTVSKIGRKYFYVQDKRFPNLDPYRFNIETEEYSPWDGIDDCNSDYILFPSLDALKEENTRLADIAYIRDIVRSQKFNSLPAKTAEKIWIMLHDFMEA